MVEGLLLQVSLPEVQNLYNVLLDRVGSLHTDRCTSPPPAEPTDCSPHMHFNSQGNNHQVHCLPDRSSHTFMLALISAV